MSLPRGSLGFLNEKAVSGCGRTRDRLRGCPERGQFAVSHSEGDDRNRRSHAHPLSHSERRPPALAGSAGHVPRRRHYGTDVSDELSVDSRTDSL